MKTGTPGCASPQSSSRYGPGRDGREAAQELRAAQGPTAPTSRAPAGCAAARRCRRRASLLVHDGRIAWANGRRRAGRLRGRAGRAARRCGSTTLFADTGRGLPDARRPARGRVRAAAARTAAARWSSCRPASGAAGPGDAAGVSRTSTRVRDARGRAAARAAASSHAANRELDGAARALARRERAEREELLHGREPRAAHAAHRDRRLQPAAARARRSGPLTRRAAPLPRGEPARAASGSTRFVANLLEAARAATRRGALELGASAARAGASRRSRRCSAPLLRRQRRRARSRSTPERALRARFDPLRVEQVLTNLIGNALRYAPPRDGRSRSRRAAVPPTGARFVEVAVARRRAGRRGRAIATRIFEPYVQVGRARARRRPRARPRDLPAHRRGARRHDRRERAAGRRRRFVFTLPAARASRRARASVAQSGSGAGARRRGALALPRARRRRRRGHPRLPREPARAARLPGRHRRGRPPRARAARGRRRPRRGRCST